MSEPLKAGDRIRMKVRTMGGWKGLGTVVRQDGEVVAFTKDGDSDWPLSVALRKEVSLVAGKEAGCR